MPKSKKTSSKRGNVQNPRQIRIAEVENLVQADRNMLCSSGPFKNLFRFSKDEIVVAFSEGLWYEAVAAKYYKMTPPERVSGSTVQFPTYWMEFIGWSKKHSEEIGENELISCVATHHVDIFGMLVAHEWNLMRRDSLGYTRKQMGNGVWFLSDATYDSLQNLWQDNTKETRSFAEFCGRPNPKL